MRDLSGFARQRKFPSIARVVCFYVMAVFGLHIEFWLGIILCWLFRCCANFEDDA